jgi:putative PEP-CTERM system integral membrane protein
MKTFVHILCSAIFWIWNLAFLCIVYAGILPHTAPFIWRDTLAGEVPPTFLVSLAALVIVPTICTIIGWFRLRKHPVLLMRLFYGVEAPIFALCLLRLFIIREMNPASAQILGTIALCILAFGMELLCGYAARQRALAWLQMVSHSLMLIVSLYVGTLLTFYTVPALCTFLYHFFQFQWLWDLWDTLTFSPLSTAWWMVVFILLFGFSCTVFFAMPFALVNMYTRSWWRISSAFGLQYGWWRARATAGGVAIAWFLMFIMLQQQPQAQAFELLDRPAQTASTRQELLAKSETIRAGLVNAYLSSYRYLSPRKDSNQLREMYRGVFHLPPSQAQFWQDFHNHWLAPFLYQGDRNDANNAAKLYAQFFDQPIQKAERPAIQQALQATVNRDETQAGLLNINQQIVWLAQQRVNVHEHGDWADIELYEQYHNPTPQDQEIFYSFSLPESAVITGLWLGDGMSRERRFRFTVSSRGAAQRVYKGEVERSNFTVAEDPALLEQVGPRQYRLRVFPIPARETINKPGELHLWMTYKVMQQGDGWVLPHLTEKRNIFWTKDTIRRRNGRPIQSSADTWLEAALPAKHPVPELHEVNLANYRISAKPLIPKDYSLPNGKRFAIIVDSSRSMNSHTHELSKTFHWLNKNTTSNDVDVYLTASSGAGPKRIDDLHQFNPDKTVFYGSLQIPEMLQQFVQLQSSTQYDAVLVLTDEGSYELSKDEAELPAIAPPLWLIHLGGQLSHAYDDATLQLIQTSQGGVATDLPEVMRRLATEAKLGQAVAAVTDDYSWTVESTETTQPIAQDPAANFAPLAARQLILKLSREQDMTQLEALDAVHTIAKTTEIVTPYSSMLVLVNDRQRELLRQAEASGDRFNREVENGQEQLNQPSNPLRASIPEPGNVVGMGVVAIVLILVARHRP